jgi:arylesterase / paraoxonase
VTGNPVARSALTIVVMLVLAVGVFAVRGLEANGVFSGVSGGFSGSCKTLPVAGVSDIEIDSADHLALLAVMDARKPGPSDGIYTLDLSGPAKLIRLAGAPADFHPRGIGLSRTANGGLFLVAINHRGTGRFSIDTFEVTRKDGVPALAAQGTIEGGLLTDPQDVAMTGPNSFYVSNTVTGKNAVMRVIQSYGLWPGGDIVLFNGTAFREVVNGLTGPRGLALTADGSHLLVANVTGRSLLSLNREMFTGNLSEAGSLSLPSGPDHLTLDGQGNIWAAGHVNLFSWRSFGRDPAARAASQVFKVTLSGGVPQSADQIYANDGSQIASASAAAAAGKRLLIGSSLDGKLLDCQQ